MLTSIDLECMSQYGIMTRLLYDRGDVRRDVKLICMADVVWDERPD